MTMMNDEHEQAEPAPEARDTARRGRARERYERRRKGAAPGDTDAAAGAPHIGSRPLAPALSALRGALKRNPADQTEAGAHENTPGPETDAASQRRRWGAPNSQDSAPAGRAVMSEGEIDFLKLVPPRLDAAGSALNGDEAATSAPDAMDSRRVRARARRMAAGMAARPTGHARPSGAARAGFSPEALLEKARGLDLARIRVIAYVIVAVGVMLAVILGLGLFKDEPLFVGSNAIWLGADWTHEARPTDEVVRLVGRLQENGIATVYARVSWLRDDLTWAGNPDGQNVFDEVREPIQRFVVQFRTMYPDAVLYGWIDFPVNRGPQGYRLGDPAAQAAVADFSLTVLAELGFDGVFLNVDPVLNPNADDFINLLRRVNLRIGDEGALAVAVPPDYTPSDGAVPQSPLYAPGTAWDAPFKQRVALLVDEIALTPYRSGLDDRVDYVDWFAYQVAAYAEAIAETEAATRIMVGIPTYDSDPPALNASVENIPAALEGLQQGLEAAGRARAAFQGVALFAEWTTDETEWRLFNQLWR